MLEFFDEIVPGTVPKSTGPRGLVAESTHVIAAGVDEARRPGDDFLIGQESFGNDKRAGVARSRPPPAPVPVIPQHPVPFRGIKLSPSLVFQGYDEAGRTQAAAPDPAQQRVAAAVEVFVGQTRLQSLERAAGNEVGDTADGVGTIYGAGAFLQDLHPLYGDGRKRVHVHEPASHQPAWHIGLTPAVQQHQCTRGPQPSQVDIRHGFRNARRGPVVPAAHLAHYAAAGAQVLEEVDHGRGALLGQFIPIEHRYGHGKVYGCLADGRAGYHDLLGFQHG